MYKVCKAGASSGNGALTAIFSKSKPGHPLLQVEERYTNNNNSDDFLSENFLDQCIILIDALIYSAA